MEQLNDTPHPDYSKGFNNGYLMAKHFPDVSKDLIKSLNETEQSKGFEAGVRQAFLEKLRTTEKSWTKEHSALKDKEKSKDSKEMERD